MNAPATTTRAPSGVATIALTRLSADGFHGSRPPAVSKAASRARPVPLALLNDPPA
ncbi:hypothetical protein GCM10025868_14810 [Angustibacter aerolatus]|uniref:Uncharacterized protein n=1 Tax=Angustibacter aerolatus TaxID=1162965 RepID=A0ABQ6JDG8_9ACTN|nr:hypothetical protein GCM10025868_14810 [Angustibacter aerolatus]